MNVFTTTLMFLGLSFVTFFLVNRYVKRWFPDLWLSSRLIMSIFSVVFAFGAVYFITRWGFRPAVITINLRQNVDNPIRWINWLLSAVSFGVAQSFLVELLRTRVEEEAPPEPRTPKTPKTKATQGRRADML